MEGKLDYGEYVDKNQVRRQATTIIAGRHRNTPVEQIHERQSSHLFFAFLSRQHRLPERQHSRQNLKNRLLTLTVNMFSSTQLKEKGALNVTTEQGRTRLKPFLQRGVKKSSLHFYKVFLRPLLFIMSV